MQPDPTTAPRPRAVLVDIDGTLAERGDRSPYDWSRVGEDQPRPAVIELVQTLAAAGRHRIILLSGRDDVCRDQTVMWLDAQGVPFDELHMRARKDNRRDSVVKEELYRSRIEGRYRVAFVVDDRDQVVKMWRDLGLDCFQVAEGAF
ncbi:polynucleotide kinase [Micromonospora sp. WP24]|uniref:phosphatase domain-containing protein n=1 Tax=Micromonospora sp. WP24 TaxID=2604469 RepID=UPI0011D667FC|nr:polynucleotide kinase [Micromonospora sp. WP24]TYC01679.1 polynucleotide kinase [Micromonospora sp. WP24]